MEKVSSPLLATTIVTCWCGGSWWHRDGWLIQARVSGLWGREEDDDVASFCWLNFKCLDVAMCHSLIGQFNKWRIATWHDLSAS